MDAPRNAKIGERRVDVRSGYMKVKTERGWKLEHRVVMAEARGRDLRPGEQVHHLNGVKVDNRLANLELWSSAQPPGQRIEDKLWWAQGLIDTYGDEYSAPVPMGERQYAVHMAESTLTEMVNLAASGNRFMRTMMANTVKEAMRELRFNLGIIPDGKPKLRLVK